MIEGETALDEVMYQITNHFFDDQNKQNYFIKIFLKKELVETVMDLIKNAVSNLYQNRRFDTNTFSEFEKLIEIIKNDEKQRIIGS